MEVDLNRYGGVLLSHAALSGVLDAYRRPNDKIHSLIKSGDIIRLARGKYVINPKVSGQSFSFTAISNGLYGPSYVSLEYMLRYYNAIPEHVFAVTAVTTKRSVTRKTAIGTFSYRNLPDEYYPLGIKLLSLDNGQYSKVASPEKALLDTIICTPGIRFRSIQSVCDWVHFMRISEEFLESLDVKYFSEWLKVCPKKESVKMLINYLNSND